MFVILCIILLALGLWLVTRDKKLCKRPIRRRDLKTLQADLEAWERGERPRLRDLE